MRHLFVGLSVCFVVTACGPRPRPVLPDEDAGVVEVPDAGRVRGDDPPNGFSTAVELPEDGGQLFGVSVAAVGDQFGHPLIAAVWDDPNGDGQRSDTRVFFTRWTGEKKAYEPLKTIEVVGEIAVAGPNRQVSIARDSITGRIGIAYVKTGGLVRFAFSDDEGANFSLVTVGTDPGTADPSFPQVALRGGVTHLAYQTSTDEVLYRKRTGNTGAFSEERAAVTAGQAAAFGPVSLALDSSGAPGLAYFTKGASLRGTLAFWRPGTTTAAAIANSGSTDVLTVLNRRPSVSLVFVGTTPRVAFHLLQADPNVTDRNPELFTSAAADASGTTWSTPVGLPRNGDFSVMTFNSTQWYQALVVHGNGSVVIGAAVKSKGTSMSNTECWGGPKFGRSTDGAMFTTCAPANTPVTFAGDWISMWAHAPGKVTAAFFFDRRANDLVRGGVILWREQ